MRSRRIRASLLAAAVCAGMGMPDAARDFMGWGGRINAGGTPAVPDAGGAGVVWYVDDDGFFDPGPGDPSISDPCENGSINHPY